jgi:hypothetical protein
MVRYLAGGCSGGGRAITNRKQKVDRAEEECGGVRRSDCYRGSCQRLPRVLGIQRIQRGGECYEQLKVNICTAICSSNRMFKCSSARMLR